jgi:hypothetical protein
MGLNDETKKEFKEITLEDDLVIPPQSENIKPSGQDITLIPANPSMSYKEPDQDVIESLPEANLKIQVIDDKLNQVFDLKEVESDILGLEGICISDVIVLESYMPDFFNGKVTKNHYSQTSRSKTQFDYTKKCIESSIIEKEAEIITDMETVIMPLINTAISSLITVKDDIETSILGLVRSKSYEYDGIVEKLEASKETFYPVNNEFISIVNSELQLVNFNMISIKDSNELEDYKNIILKILENPVAKVCFFSALNNDDFQNCFNNIGLMKYKDCPVKGLDLFKYLTSTSIAGYLEYVVSSVYSTITKLSISKEKIETLTDSQNKSNEIREIIPVIQDSIDEAFKYVRFVTSTRLLFTMIDKMGKVYKQL